MRTTAAALVLSLSALASAIDAPVVTGNPPGASYVATLPEGKSSITGSIVGTSASDGTGVKWSVSFAGFPAAGGPFLYHVHVDPVPADGNCTSTLAHLDPYARGEDPPCDPAAPQTCQVGDLSGKFGKISTDPYSAEYTDPYSSTQPGTAGFFGNRSVVVHYANKTRITCANFVLSGSNGTGPSPTGGSGGAGGASGSLTYSVPTPTGSPIVTGAAVAKNAAAGVALGGAVAAAVFLL